MWSDGYVTDVEYTHWFFPETSPNNLAFSSLLGQLNWQVTSQDFTYLELGFGQGLSLNINAAVTPGTYWGTDFNPAHAANALDLAKASGSHLNILDASFEEMASREDLPDFDAIVLHGIWSWISNKNRYFITEILRKHLKPGGICYISYNTQPGWSGMGPLQTLLLQHAQAIGNGPLSSRVDAALEFAESLASIGAQYFKDQPAALEKLKSIQGQNRQYVAHEFFNTEWHPMPFAVIAKDLSEIQLSFGVPAMLFDQLDKLNFSQEARQLLHSIKDPAFSESVKDYLLNRQFRRDIFIKGARPLSGFERYARLKKTSFTIVKDPDKLPEYVNVPMGRVMLSPDIYHPLIEALSAHDFSSKTILEIQEFKSCQALSLNKIMEAVQVLCGARFVMPVQSNDAAERSRSTASALNRELCRQAEFSSDTTYLASPLIGTGVPVSRIDQIFLRAETLGVMDVPKYTWDVLKAQGERRKKDGIPLQDDAKNLAQLTQDYKAFAEDRRPRLQRLGVTCEK